MESMFGLSALGEGRSSLTYKKLKPSKAFSLGRDEDDQRKRLKRKLDIQKARNRIWRVRWAKADGVNLEKSLGHDNIDESLSRAGLADVALSVMGTIDDILSEMDRMWDVYGQESSGSGSSTYEKFEETKTPTVVWDKERFKGLMTDLTSSIDTLNDISGTRQAAKPSSPPKKFEMNIQTEKAFEKSRMDTPMLIDPSRLRNSNRQSIVFVNSDGSKSLVVPATKDILYLIQSGDVKTWNEASEQPVFVEFANYDDVYSATGIGPSMTRFEKLFAALQRERNNPDKPDFGVLNLLGYFEDVEKSRFGLVYETPDRARDEESAAQTSPLNLGTRLCHCRLADLLNNRSAEPPLEIKFHLAYRLATSVFDLHSRGVVHGNMASANVIFFEDNITLGNDNHWQENFDVRKPYLTSYDLFPEPASNGESQKELPHTRWYRHKLDPRLAMTTKYTTESKELDLHSLGLLLMEIGLWQSLRESESAISSSGMALKVKDGHIHDVYRMISTRCGTAFRKAVQACYEAVEDTASDSKRSAARSDVQLQKLYGQVLSWLQKCCAIDDDVDDEAGDITTLDFDSPPKLAKKTPFIDPTPPASSPPPPSPKPYVRPRRIGIQTQRQLSTISPTKESANSFAEMIEDGGFDKAIPDAAAFSFQEAAPDTNVTTDAPTSVDPLLRRKIKFTNRLAESDPTKTEEITATSETDKDIENAPQLSDLPAERAADTAGDDVANDPTETDESGQKQEVRLFPTVQLMKEHYDNWNQCLMPQINHALRRFYRKNINESVEISLESIGETPQKVKPTILVVCTSVGKVKAVLKKHFTYDSSTYGLIVCRGQMTRSRKKRRDIERSMGHSSAEMECDPENSQYQERPLHGASICAFSEGQLLNPCSFGGMITLGDKTLGLTVHHMLDVPSDDEDEGSNNSSESNISSLEHDGYAKRVPLTAKALHELGHWLRPSDEYDDTSSASSFDSEDLYPPEPGDIGRISPEFATSYLVTQPAYDDMPEAFFRNVDDPVNAHLLLNTVGKLYASSGLRRKQCHLGMFHEIDWALFEFIDARKPVGNLVRGSREYCSATKYPTNYVPTHELGGLDVHTMGRTTGLSYGYIPNVIVSVKLKGRLTASHSFQIAHGGGMPGDSGAWVFENKEGRACGHILAWSETKQVAYFCPMDVMMEDIARKLGDDVGFAQPLEEEPARIPRTRPAPEHTEQVNRMLINAGLMRPSKIPTVKLSLVKEVDDFELVNAMDGMHMSTEVIS